MFITKKRFEKMDNELKALYGMIDSINETIYNNNINDVDFKKSIEKMVNKNTERIENIEEDLRLREWLIKTKFKGDLQDTQVIEKLEKEKFTINGITYKEICEKIKDYNLGYVDVLVKKLKELKKEQKLLKKYKEGK